MKALILIDKFKSSLTSIELGKITKNVLETKNMESDYYAISDGGDGFLACLESTKKYKKINVKVLDAFNNLIDSYYLIDGNNAYIEVAKIVGISMYKKLNPVDASSIGIGNMIVDAIKHNAKNIFIGLGGTMTNDCGLGMLNALGFTIKDNKLVYNKVIDLENINFYAICDVTNPLLGKNGATQVYGRQKGATDKTLVLLEKRNETISLIISKYLNNYSYIDYQGSGAAGGIGFALLSLIKAKFVSGIDFTLNYLNIDNIISNYDFIITGEGKIDNQSFNGKVIDKIIKRYNLPIYLVCGVNDYNEKLDDNVIGIYSIVNKNISVEKSMANAIINYQNMIMCIDFKQHFVE